MFRSIRWKLTTTYLFIIAVSLTAIGGYFLWRMEEFYMQNLQNHLFNEALISGELFSSFEVDRSGDREMLDGICKRLGEEMESRLTFIAPDGTVLADSLEDPQQMENHLGRPEIQAALQEGEGVARRFSTTLDKEMFYVALSIEGAEGLVRVSVPLSFIKESVARLRLILLSGLLLALLISFLLSRHFSGRITRPMEEIGEVAGSIAEGDFDRKVAYHGRDELAQLADTINDMGRTLKDKVEQISREKSKLETVMSSMTSGVIYCDALGRIDFLNEAAGNIFGVEKEKAAGHPLRSILRNLLLHEKFQESIKEGEVMSFELNLFYPQTRVLQVHIVPVESGGGVVGALAVFHDITGLRSLERMRRDFVANVSHELRTPLTTIKGYAETLLEEDNCRDPETVMKISTVINKEAERLTRLLNDLLNLSRIESSKGLMKKQRVDLKNVLEEALSMMRPRALENSLKLTMEVQEEVAVVEGDPDWLLQLFIDLLDNAVKYNSARGYINVSLYRKGREAVVSVEDSGMGIPAENLPYIFERFYRADRARSRSLGGTGLGLAIVKHIVEAHGGRIEVSSSVGRGSTFYVYLPAAA